jgi:hypothetical protein
MRITWPVRSGVRMGAMAAVVLAALLLAACRPASEPENLSEEATATQAAVLADMRTPDMVPAGVIEYHMSPTCGCCEVHQEQMADFAAQNDLEFEIYYEESTTLNYLKRATDIPPTHWACHTAYVEGYYLEGHVPIDAVGWLLEARPENVKGIATRHTVLETSQITWLGNVYYIIYDDGTIQGPISAKKNELSITP